MNGEGGITRWSSALPGHTSMAAAYISELGFNKIKFIKGVYIGILIRSNRDNFFIRSPIDSILEPLDSYRNFGDFDTSFVTIRDRIEKSEKSQNELRKPIKFHITRNWA